MRKEVIASIIANSQKELDERIKKVKFVEKYQLDIMDGKFVKNESFQFDFKLPKANYEAHLMTKQPELWINYLAKQVKTFYFHIETTKQPLKLINLIKKHKRKVGIAISPRTKIEKIKPYLKKIDNVLVMSVYPGKYGAKFLPNTLKKVENIRKLVPKINIEVDGAINNKTIELAKNAGANLFISGSYLQKNKKLGYNKLIKLIKG